MKQLSRSAQKRDDNRRIFASLRLVNGDRIGKLQFFQQFKRILYFSLFIVFNFQCFSICIDLGDNSHIAIKNPHSFIHRQSILGCDLPFKLIVILDLHHLVAHAEFVIAIFFFRFSRSGGFKYSCKILFSLSTPNSPFRIGVSTWISYGFALTYLGSFFWISVSRTLMITFGSCLFKKKKSRLLLSKGPVLPG